MRLQVEFAIEGNILIPLFLETELVYAFSGITVTELALLDGSEKPTGLSLYDKVLVAK